MKTLKTLLIGLFVSISCLASAQVAPEQPSDKVSQMHTRKWEYLVDKSKLTPSEADQVKPIFMEYEKLCWERHRKDRDFFHSAFNTEGSKKPDYQALNNHYSEMDLVQGKMFKSYHSKLSKILSPETLFRYYQAEREFKQKLLRDMGNRKRPQEPRN